MVTNHEVSYTYLVIWVDIRIFYKLQGHERENVKDDGVIFQFRVPAQDSTALFDDQPRGCFFENYSTVCKEEIIN